MWLKAPTDIKLLANEVHVWRENLVNVESLLKQFKQILSEDELIRAKRFHFEEHRQRFIAGRGILRSILGRYLNIQPSKIQFDYEPRGKPFLNQSYHTNLSFNLSHSQDFALYAISLTDSIGVDLECFNSTTDVLSLAQRFFLATEFTTIKSAHPQQQQQLFFRYWTCKEAYLKATGIGLKDLQKVEVSLTPEQPARLNVPGEWNLVEIEPFTNCAAAIAIPGQNFQLKYWDFGV
ncbi:4'-phosphopantetheinyl transferase superfamily protein [Plectonema cf. radiosum LEGE 06105]|uniref:4'-phosphopantetheinyl transferase superfamily protein n=1 Tax=Plectonema cf. radiosum LEGE 06105 TaxID=945769 RepID=A0A8J7FE68_9CYAN|nr:4'-phosphopantetheinyl transferase superfamily protein [Plectonema radiosum]MBE9217039.1 4'-phosphopantetheinyl transferase superfamily protein [Plectonema cf. radiosum LEGE 06105]